MRSRSALFPGHKRDTGLMSGCPRACGAKELRRGAGRSVRSALVAASGRVQRELCQRKLIIEHARYLAGPDNMANKVTQRYFFVAAACICAVTVLAAGILVQGNETKRTVDRFPEPGYVIGDPVISEEFRGLPLGVGIRATGGRTSYSIGEDGLKVTLDNNASSLYLMKSSMTANSTRMKLDLSSLDASHFLGLSIKFSSAKTSSWYYSAAIMLTPNKITVAPHIWLGEGTIEYESFSFMYDVRARGTVDIAVEVSGGNLNVGVDGFQHSFRTGRAEDRLVFAGATLEANRERWSSPAAVVIKRMDIGNGGSVTYRDRPTRPSSMGPRFLLGSADTADQANLACWPYEAIEGEYGVRGEFGG